MTNLSHIAIIGSGPSAIYLLHHIWKNIDVLRPYLKTIAIFEKASISGRGMPYSPQTTDIYNLANISSEEIPVLHHSFGNWLREQPSSDLKKLNITELPINDKEVYSRLALGSFFEDQFKTIIEQLKLSGISVTSYEDKEIVDIRQFENSRFEITDKYKKSYRFSTVIIANGHVWKEEDTKERGYYASPWPIQKIVPKEGDYYNFSIGTLGASLSAFDVVTTLSHRHGTFETIKGGLKFIKDKNAPNFKMVLHSAEGWLPHLQYEQQEPLRELYRHFTREQLLGLIDDAGVMRIDDYFDTLCRPALMSAFKKDSMPDVVEKLQTSEFSFSDLVELMSEKHEYVNSFEGMKEEMVLAKQSVLNNVPINWMETLDDLMYSLNFHAEYLPAEDHLFFHNEIMGFLMNVIAALPLQSAEILLALYDAGSIELVKGYVDLDADSPNKNSTLVTVEQKDGSTEEFDYQLFINCSGEKKLELEDFPFPGLIDQKILRAPLIAFRDPTKIDGIEDTVRKAVVDADDGRKKLKLSGIDIDASYRTVNDSGEPNTGLYNINFTHTNGLRPYSYGLQACNATSLIVVESWVTKLSEGLDVADSAEEMTKFYDEHEDL